MKVIITIEGEEVKNVEVLRDTEKIEDGILNTIGSIYSAWFDDTCAAWTKNPRYNKMFLEEQESFYNDLLKQRGHLFLNEVYEGLGIPKTKAGQMVGWIYNEQNPIGDNRVDFGLNHERATDFNYGQTRSVLLDFNVDGIIIDKI